MIGLTLWRSSRFDLALADSEALLRAVRPPLVCLHLWPTDDSARYVEAVRAILPDVRVWLSPGCNGLADDSLADVRAQARRWARRAIEQGAECLLLNLEGSSAPGYPGWTSSDPTTLASLADRARALLEEVATTAPSVALGLTSHDCPSWHHLPWSALLGERSPVTIHAPQVYPGIKRPGASLAACRARWSLATRQWASFVQRGVVRADLGPQGSGWVTYTQGWGAAVAGSCWLLDQRDRGLVWASPTRLWPEGRAALAASCEVRRQAGDSAGAIARWQASKSLAADGIVGPRTLAALGLAV